MGRSSRWTSPIAATLAVVLVASCTGGEAKRAAGPTTTGGAGLTSTTSPTSTTGGPSNGSGGNGRVVTGADGKLAVFLSAGVARTTGGAASTAVVAGTELSVDALAPIVARLPPWVDDAALPKSFNWPTKSLTVPRAGATTQTPFPAAGPPAPAPASAAGPLEVTRVQPEGDVPIAPFVTLTFNQPMVPVATVAQLDAAAVPVTISPAVPGRWRWVGTQTLRFDASDAHVDRLPMATEFTVTVPTGTTSATGGSMAKARSFTFRTPPVTVQTVQPDASRPLTLTPVLVASFDQRVDPGEVLKHVTLTADGDARPVRLATADELQADHVVSTDQLVGRWIAFRPVDPLPADASIAVDIGKGTPSAEGPIVTPGGHPSSWRTYAPLRIVRADCGGGDCPPTSVIQIEFDNELDAAKFDPAAIAVSPDLAGMSVVAFGNVVEIRGATKARTTYSVTMPAALNDIYGQTLGTVQTKKVAIGASQPMLEQFASLFTTIDPLAGKPSLTIATVNHDKVRLRLFAVAPDQWPSFERYVIEAQQRQPGTESPAPPWRAIVDRKVTIDDKPDERVETRVDLADALGGDNLGHLVAIVETTETYGQNDDRYWLNRPAVSWLQATQLGVDAFADNDELRVWTTELATGAPVAGVQVAALGADRPAATGPDGVARLALSSGSISALTAMKGPDVALLPHDVYQGNWSSYPLSDDARWYVVDDRHTYRPGETVSVKGVVRRFASTGDERLHVVVGGTVHYVVNDAQGIGIGEGDAALSPLGGFDLSFAVAAGANTGPASITFAADIAGVPGAAFSHPFAIQEFRRPEYEVVTRSETAESVVSSRPATVAVDAHYYAGGPLGAAPVTWAVTTNEASYSPPGWTGWSFGKWTPWWSEPSFGGGVATDGFGRGFGGPEFGGPGFGGADVKNYTGTTGPDGSQFLRLDFAGKDGVLPDLPVTVRAQATVQDVNRQVLASTTNLLVHPSDFYVGLRGTQTFVKQGDPIAIDAVVTSIDGKVTPGRAVRVTASRTDWKLTNGAYVEVPVDVQTCDRTSGTEPVACSFATSVGGTYSITATVVDDHGATNRTELTRWVSGGLGRPDRSIAREQLTVVPAKADYAPGDTAEVLVQAPFAAGHGIVTISHVGLDATQQFDVVGGTAIVRLPLSEADVPGMDLSFEVVGTTPRTGDDGRPLDGAPPRPAFAVGALALKVSTASRTLTVKATPEATTLAPGASTKVDLAVTGPDGAPAAGAEVAVAVVDEAVLALGPYRWPDPLELFYGPHPGNQQTTYGRESIALAAPHEVTGGATLQGAAATGGAATTAAAAAAGTVPPGARVAAPGAPAAADESAAKYAAAAAGGGPPGPAIDLRTNFDALAVFRPSITTDAVGRAVVDVRLPDNLTRYRVMVLAVQGDDRFGSTDAEITARKPLMVRPSAPRFLNFGDVFELPVVVQNQTDQAMAVDLALQTSNLAVNGAPGRRVDVPANDRIEVRFPVAAVAAGTARLRIAATGTSGGPPVNESLSDATTVELPVYTPVTTEAFATYGVLDDGATVQPVLAPTGVVPQFGGLDVTTSSTALQGLTDAVIDVVHYPYESADGRAARILTITSLRDVLSAFASPQLPDAATLDGTVAADVAGLVALQNGEGGFGFWERGRPSDPYVTVRATDALVAARKAGVNVPGDVWARALQYLANIEQFFPATYSEQLRDTTNAYALHVRDRAGDRDVTKAEQLWNRRHDALGVDAIAWLWPVVDDRAIGTEIARLISNRAVETAGAVNFSSSYRDDAYVILQSDRRIDAVVLDALIARQPESALIPKVVTGLLGHRTAGKWSGIEESSFILGALKTYFDTYERQTPQFVARVWLGDRYAGDQSFAGRSTDRLNVNVPTSELVAAGDSTVVVAKEGTGRLYYRIGLTYAPSDLQSAALDRGFVVQRVYEAVDSPGDVTLDAAGVWHVKAGANVRVRLTMVAESQRTHVALVDALPAGLEIVNPALATTPDIPPPAGSAGSGGGAGVPSAIDVRALSTPSFWYPTWFEHQNLKDDRAEAFASLLPGGVYDYSYVARATTPGTFVAPPTRAEQIYEPETFGRSASAKVVVES